MKMSENQEKAPAKGKDKRKNLALSDGANNYWDDLPTGDKGGTFSDIIDLGILLDKAGLKNPEAIQAVIDSGVFNLFEIITNENLSADARNAAKWAAAKSILGDEISIIKASSIAQVEGGMPIMESRQPPAPEVTQGKAKKVMPARQKAGFLN